MKKLLPLFIAVILIVILAVPSFAASIEQYSYNGVVLPKLPVNTSDYDNTTIFVLDEVYYLSYTDQDCVLLDDSGTMNPLVYYQCVDNEWVYIGGSSLPSAVPVWSDKCTYKLPSEPFFMVGDSSFPYLQDLVLDSSLAFFIYYTTYRSQCFLCSFPADSLKSLSHSGNSVRIDFSSTISMSHYKLINGSWSFFQNEDNSYNLMSCSELIGLFQYDDMTVLDPVSSFVVPGVVSPENSLVYLSPSEPVVSFVDIPDPPPEPFTVKKFMNHIGQILRSAVSWVSDVGAAILAQPLLLAFTALPLCGLGIAVFRRLKETV